jgi:hypothetical protein
MKPKLFAIVLLLLYWFSGCTDCPTNTESPDQLVLLQTLTLDFTSPFETESITLTEGIYYEVKFSGEFYYDIQTYFRLKHYTSQSGFWTKYSINIYESDWKNTFRDGSPLTIDSYFIKHRCLAPAFNPEGIYSFEGICIKTEIIKFNFQNPWDEKVLQNTSGQITVEIFMMEEK